MIAIVRAVREGRITWKTLPRDVLAGLVVGIVAIPLAMAFAIASGLEPEQGLYTGIIAGVLVSCLGGSQVQIAGPTGAFIVVLLGVVQEHGTTGLLVATILAGGLLVALGIARMGVVIRYIPHPVVVGFTAGIGVIIFTGQIAHFFGLRLAENPREFVDKALQIARAAPTASWSTALVGGVTLATILLFPKVTRRVPAPLVGMLLGTVVALVFHLPVATIGSTFGEIPRRLPTFHVPDFDWSKLDTLIGPALTIAMLGAIESLLSAVVADGMTGETHDSNQELIGQGIANVVTPFFGGFAATGAIARTATNVRNGGRSPVSGIVHALVLLATMLLFAPYAGHVPLASLAAILFIVAWNMSEVHAVAGLLTGGSRSDKMVLLTTLGLTVFVDLVVAVEVGVVLAALLFMKHMAERVEMRAVLPTTPADDPYHELLLGVPPEIRIFAVDGPMFFGVAHRFENTVAAVEPGVRVVIVRLWRVPYLDASGANALRRAVRALRRGGRRVVLAGVRPPVRRELERSGLLTEIGEEKVWETFEEALFLARELLLEERMQAATAKTQVVPRT
jgi:SulP family sulfate permease